MTGKALEALQWGIVGAGGGRAGSVHHMAKEVLPGRN